MISINARLADAGFRPPDLDLEGPDDLEKGECVVLALRSVFPLPGTGTFTDLLAAIDGAEDKS